MGEVITEQKENAYTSLDFRLQKMEHEGVRLYLDGRPATPDAIARCCVNEETLYMPDYVTDKQGKIKEIRYDKVSES